MTLRIIASGGTFDKHYDELAGQLGFGDSHLPAVLQRSRITLEHTLEVLPLLDSLQMQDADRQRLLDSCRQARSSSSTAPIPCATARRRWARPRSTRR